MPGAPHVDARVPVQRPEPRLAPARVAAGRMLRGPDRRRPLDAPAADAVRARRAGRHHPRPVLPRRPEQTACGNPARLPGAGRRSCPPRRRRDRAISDYTAGQVEQRSASRRTRSPSARPARRPGRARAEPAGRGPSCSSARSSRARTSAGCSRAYAALVARRRRRTRRSCWPAGTLRCVAIDLRRWPACLSDGRVQRISAMSTTTQRLRALSRGVDAGAALARRGLRHAGRSRR